MCSCLCGREGRRRATLTHAHAHPKAARAEEREHASAMTRAMKPFMGYKPLMPSVLAYMDLGKAEDTRTDEERAEDDAILKAHSLELVRDRDAHTRQMNAMFQAKARAVDRIPEGPLREHALTYDMSDRPSLPLISRTPPDPEVPERVRLIKEMHLFYLRDHELAKKGTLSPVQATQEEGGKKKKKKKNQ